MSTNNAKQPKDYDEITEVENKEGRMLIILFVIFGAGLLAFYGWLLWSQ